MPLKIGQGFDVHGFEPGKPLRLGGLTIPSDFGLKGHSDGDVVLHAVCDALLGAASLGDIGEHFPDTDPTYEAFDSVKFLEIVLQKIQPQQLRIEHIDITIIAQIPRIGPYKLEIKKHLATLLGCALESVNIKATTTEAMGFIGREEGMAAMAVVLLASNDNIAE